MSDRIYIRMWELVSSGWGEKRVGLHYFRNQDG